MKQSVNELQSRFHIRSRKANADTALEDLSGAMQTECLGTLHTLNDRFALLQTHYGVISIVAL